MPSLVHAVGQGDHDDSGDEDIERAAIKRVKGPEEMLAAVNNHQHEDRLLQLP